VVQPVEREVEHAGVGEGDDADIGRAGRRLLGDCLRLRVEGGFCGGQRDPASRVMLGQCLCLRMRQRLRLWLRMLMWLPI